MKREIWKEVMDADWGLYEYLHDEINRYYGTLGIRLRQVEMQSSEFFAGNLQGTGHAERVMILGTLIAALAPMDDKYMPWVIDACAWHDIMRRGNGTDVQHGEQAADIVERYTVARGDDLRIVQAAIAAHSRGDRKMRGMMDRYGVQDRIGCELVACVLKDADALDRVRSGDLNEKYLRLEPSKSLIGFAQWLYGEWR